MIIYLATTPANDPIAFKEKNKAIEFVCQNIREEGKEYIYEYHSKKTVSQLLNELLECDYAVIFYDDIDIEWSITEIALI